MGSSSRSGRRGTRTPKRLAPPPVFKTGSSSGRMPSVSPNKLRGLESNQRPPGSEPGVTTNSNYPGSSRHTISKEARGEGVEPPSPGSKPGGLPLTDPRSRKSALRESNPPRQLGRLEPLPLGQGHVSNPGGRRGIRTLKAITLDRFRGGCHRRLACPSVFEAAVAGIEPASVRLTAACPYQHGPHRIKSA